MSIVELSKHFSSHELSAKTRSNYENYYQKLKDLVQQPILECPEDEIITEIKKSNVSPASKQNYLNIAVVIKKSNGYPIDKLLEFRNMLKKDIISHVAINNEKLREITPSQKFLKGWIEQLYTDGKFLDYIVNFLIFNYGCRNQDVDCFVVKNIKQTGDMGRNYLVMHKLSIDWIRNVYKTAGTYQQKKVKIQNKHFINALNTLRPNGGWLLQTEDGAHISETSLNKVVSKKTYNGLGQGAYFKINVGKELKESKIKKLASNRGTDLATVAEYYDLNK